MIQQKKTYRFSDDTIITEQNIREIGELIALSSVRTRMIHFYSRFILCLSTFV